MEFLLTKIKENLNEQMLLLTISNPRKAEEIKKYNIRPVLVKDKLMFQSAAYTKTQVFHKNLKKNELVEELERLLPSYKQVQLQTVSSELTALINKKGKAAIKVKKQNNAVKAQMQTDKSHLLHNRTKKYILPEGTVVPFLKDLGVMTAEGKIVRTKYDKYRQINRFLEFIEDILPRLSRDREITILDFGCGKSYLTFAMYYYLHELKSYDIRIIGLDLKTDVIRKCNGLAKKYQYDKLTFLEGNIADYTGAEEVDMVVTLHACDTATDFALAKAIGWNAKVILSVPCCQHELNRQMKNDVLSPIMNYGLLKERMAALVTDGLRAEYLKREGYDVQVLEFIDMEHTPKNILLRAVKTGRRADNEESIRACESFLRVTPTLGRLLDEKGEL